MYTNVTYCFKLKVKLCHYRQQEFESRRRDIDRFQPGGAMGGDRMSGMIGGGEMDNRRRMEMEQRRNADLFASVSAEYFLPKNTDTVNKFVSTTISMVNNLLHVISCNK